LLSSPELQGAGGAAVVGYRKRPLQHSRSGKIGNPEGFQILEIKMKIIH
jgi:type IV secretory pathway component VirB8